MLVLIQRGKGGGLAGALGGMGGQSAFGTKAGDLFTKITIGVATFWISCQHRRGECYSACPGPDRQHRGIRMPNRVRAGAPSRRPRAKPADSGASNAAKSGKPAGQYHGEVASGQRACRQAGEKSVRAACTAQLGCSTLPPQPLAGCRESLLFRENC